MFFCGWRRLTGLGRRALFLLKIQWLQNLAIHRQLIRRTLHDNAELRDDAEIQKVVQTLTSGIDQLYKAQSVEEVVGIEGYCAQSYFSIFNKLITNKKVPFTFELRTKRPPLDPINAVLSFVYTLATSEFAAALETVGLDSYIGYCHTLRSGRVSLACDLVEEARWSC